MNRVELIGNTTSDPTITVVTTGDKKASFTLAVKGYGDETDFISIVAWRKTAEIVERYVKKGDKLGVCGRLTSRKYEDKNGDRRTVIEVRADDVDLLIAKEKAEAPKLTPAREDEELPF